AQSPDASGLHELRAFIALQSGRPDVALPHLQRALEQRPDLAATWQNYSLALERLGQEEASLQAAQRAAALDPTAEATLRVGDLQAARGLQRQARASWALAAARAPSPAAAAEIRKRLEAKGPRVENDAPRHTAPTN
ncbi:MAG: hypothetical protein ACJ8HC_11860, partial [Paraburkholderia graminis]